MSRYTKAWLAAAAMAAAPWASAQSSVTIYGVLDVGIEYAKAGSIKRTSEVSSVRVGSRFGVRGVEDLGGGNTAVFKLESGVNPDIGGQAQGGLAWGREANVGLASRDFGTVLLGRTPSAYYFNNLALDAFYSGHAGSLLATQRSTGTSNNYLTPLLANARVDNSLTYISPVLWQGLVVRGQAALGEGSTSIGRTYDGSVRYTKDAWDLVVTYMHQDGARNSNGAIRAFEAGGAYDMGTAKFFLGFTRETNDCTTCTGILARPPGLTATGSADFRLINAGLRVPFGALTAVAQVIRIQDRSSYVAATGNRDATQVAAALEYNLSKRTSVWGSIGTVGNKNGSQYAVNAGNGPRGAAFVPAGNPRASSMSVGITHFF